MSKINIPFDNEDYLIDESSLQPITSELQSHLSTVMNGSGSVIKLFGNSYNVDSTKLQEARSEFISYLGTISGSGAKVIVNGVAYNVDSTKLSDAIAELHIVLANLSTTEGGSGDEPEQPEGAKWIPFINSDSYYEWADKTEPTIGDYFTGIAETCTNYRDYWNKEGGYTDDEAYEYSELNPLGFRCTIDGVECPVNIVFKEGHSGEHIHRDSIERIEIEWDYPIYLYYDWGNWTINCNFEYGSPLYGCVVNIEILVNGLTVSGGADGGLYNEYDELIISWDDAYIDYECSNAGYVIREHYPETTKIVIPYGVESIADYAFNGCENLTTVVIPSSVGWIGNGGFAYCPNLTNITFDGTSEEWYLMGRYTDLYTNWYVETPLSQVYCVADDVYVELD